jgi:hypothetical protein
MPDMDDDGVIAKAGTEIKDRDGNLVATLTRDVHIGEIVAANMFILPNGEHPKSGEIMPPAVWEFVNSRRRPLPYG